MKNHRVNLGRAGIVLADIVASGFCIKGLGVFWLNRRHAEEFYEVYKRIFAEAEFMVRKLKQTFETFPFAYFTR